MEQLVEDQELRAYLSSKFPTEIGANLEVEQEIIQTWQVNDWCELPSQVTSAPIELGGHQWQIVLFPQGSEGARNSISLFLKRVAGTNMADTCVEFVLILHNPSDPETHSHQRVIKRYTRSTTDWGYKTFTDLRGALAPSEQTGKPLIDKDSTHLTLILRVVKDPTGILWMEDFTGYDSRAQTGLVGLMNQGATCYLNSLLQSLYFTNIFRQTVYKIPGDDDGVTDSLQSLFYLLEKSPHPVSTLPLTRSFGWDTSDAFTQHDVQELNRVLMDKLEGRLKGTEIEGFLNNIFVGQMRSYIKCVNVDFESTRVEDFWDIQLNVKGMRHVYDSFDNYVAVEMLTGENQYSSSEFGLQDAEKGVIFEKLPPVLHLQLKRYDYDFMQDMEVKINDHYEFPMELDLNKYVSKSSSGEKQEAEGEDTSYIYDLYGVLVHSGDLNAGHYYALLKPDAKSHWYRFDDDRVTRATEYEVQEENFGGPGRITSAYMLVYIQRTRADFVLSKEQQGIIPKRIQERVEEQQRQEEELRLERLEQQQNLVVRLLTNRVIAGYDDLGLLPPGFELNDRLRLRRDLSIRDGIPAIQQYLNLESTTLSFWLATVLENGAGIDIGYINNRYLNSAADQLMTWGNTNTPLIWVEEKPGNPEVQNLVFYKEFDGTKLVLCGSKWIDKNASAADLGGASGAPVYFEQRGNLLPYSSKPRLLQDPHNTSGCIIVVDKSGNDSIRQFYHDLMNRMTLECYSSSAFNASEDEEGGDNYGQVKMIVSISESYEEITAKLATQLGVEAENLMLSPYAYMHNMNYARWVVRPALRSDGANLSDLWRTCQEGDRICRLIYEVLDKPLAEHEQLAKILIFWYPDGIVNESVEPVSVLAKLDLPLRQVVVKHLKDSGQLQDTADETQVRLWGSPDLRHVKELDDDDILVSDTQRSRNDIYASVIPASEAELVAKHKDSEQPLKYVTVFHYSRDARRTHGTPFKVPVVFGEKLSRFKDVLQNFTGLHGKTFEKVKITHEPHAGNSRLLSDNDEDIYDIIADGDAIGLDHPDRRRTAYPQQSIVIK